MLKVGLVGLGSSTKEQFRRETLFLGHVSRVIVVHLMVIPGHDKWKAGMRGLEVRVQSVQRVTVSIIAQQLDLVASVFTSAAIPPLVLIDVVSKMEHHVQVIVKHVAIGRKVTRLVVLA